MDTAKTTTIKGGEFLIKDEQPGAIFSPDDFTEEQRMLRQSLQDFLNQKVESRYRDFDSELGYELAPKLLDEMGEMGFLGIGVPEAYGGFDADFCTQLAVGEIGNSAWAFGLAIGVQTSLGVAPLLLYGNEDQKAKYLPGIVSANIKSCYCLTEPGAGSDANSGKTRAVLSTDGRHYILNGQKMWITSSGHADLFFVFAKIDNDPNLSCFIVEKAFGGIRLGAEEKKMGIKGSSTRQVFFENVPVPVENLLGERNSGFKIALNVLNTGRIKMATSVTGVAKRALGYAVDYALQRVQFGQPIARFGAIQHKLGEMLSRIYVMESIAYRIGGSIDQQFAEMTAAGMDPLQAKYASIAELAMEAAMAKVHNTEADNWVIDEALQIHGGMGFSAELPIENLYRNARINRIYEGTNEINRMLTVDMLLRKGMQGKVDLMGAGKQVMDALRAGNIQAAPPANEPLGAAKAVLANAKKACLLLTGAVTQKFLAQLKQEQEVMMNLADGYIQTYALESAFLRTLKHAATYGPRQVREDLVMIQAYRTAKAIREAGMEILFAIATGQEYQELQSALNELTAMEPFDLKASRRRAATALLDAGNYDAAIN